MKLPPPLVGPEATKLVEQLMRDAEKGKYKITFGHFRVPTAEELKEIFQRKALNRT